MTAIDRCPKCNAVLAIVGIRHNCVPRDTIDPARAKILLGDVPPRDYKPKESRTVPATAPKAVRVRPDVSAASGASQTVREGRKVPKGKSKRASSATQDDASHTKKPRQVSGANYSKRMDKGARSSTVEHSKVHPAPSTAAGSNPAAPATPKRGRPRIGEKRDDTKPWLALKMSERTYYRRKKEGTI